MSIIYNETDDGKGPADLQFAVVTRFVDRFIETRGLNVVTPIDFANAINHGNVLEGTMTELFDVDVDHSNMRRWFQEHKKAAKYSAFKIIGLCNIIEYEYDGNDEGLNIANTRSYKYSEKKRFRFSLYSSDLDSPSNVSSVTPVSHNIQATGTKQVSTVNGFTELIQCTDDAACRTDVFELHERNVLFTGIMTGVKIVVSGISFREATPTKTLARRLQSQRMGGEHKSHSEDM